MPAKAVGVDHDFEDVGVANAMMKRSTASAVAATEFERVSAQREIANELGLSKQFERWTRLETERAEMKALPVGEVDRVAFAGIKAQIREVREELKDKSGGRILV